MTDSISRADGERSVGNEQRPDDEAGDRGSSRCSTATAASIAFLISKWQCGVGWLKLPAEEAMMHWFSVGVALIAAVAIIGLGGMYLFAPRTATHSFGLPLPEDGTNIDWWLRLKGTRDIVSGLVVLAMVAWGGSRLLGIVVMIEALIPLGDMTLILGARGSAKRAFGIHGITAAAMLLAAVLLLTMPDRSAASISWYTASPPTLNARQ